MIDDCEAIELRITQLVRDAPAIDPALADELVERLRHIGSPLAVSIARVLELLPEGLIDAGIALPPLAMACATLTGGVRGLLTARELEAARYEIETLLPVPEPRVRVVLDGPDVPIESLTRGPRRQT